MSDKMNPDLPEQPEDEDRLHETEKEAVEFEGIDPSINPLPYTGQTAEIDQPYQSRGIPIQQIGQPDVPQNIPSDENPYQPAGQAGPTGPPEPSISGANQPQTSRSERTGLIILVMVAVVFCVAAVVLIVAGVIA